MNKNATIKCLALTAQGRSSQKAREFHEEMFDGVLNVDWEEVHAQELDDELADKENWEVFNEEKGYLYIREEGVWNLVAQYADAKGKEYDVVHIFSNVWFPENRRLNGVHYGGSYDGIEVCLIGNKRGSAKTSGHETMHCLPDIAYVEGGAEQRQNLIDELPYRLQVRTEDDYHDRLVHAEADGITEYDSYPQIIRYMKTELRNVFTMRRLRSEQIGLLRQIIRALRKQIIKAKANARV